MQQYPKMKIDVRSHTDCRDSAKHNQKLSQARADATVAGLIQKGIQAERLAGKGYGENQLVNCCSDSVKCSEEEYHPTGINGVIPLKVLKQ